MALRATINQKVQIGVESTSGAPVAANRLIEAYTWTLGAKVTTKTFRASGRRYQTASEELTEMSGGKLDGTACYNTLVYPLSNLYGAATIAAHGASSTAKDWKWTPPISGAQTPQTFTIQNGDATIAEQYAYGLMTSWSYEVARKEEVKATHDWIGQSVTTGSTLTASPTSVAVVPMVGKHFNLYLDTSAANIGTTQVVNPIKFSFSGADYYGEFWAVNRTNASFTSHVDTAPKCEFKLQLEADATGWTPLTDLQAGSRVYVRVDAQGATIDATNNIKNEFIHDMCLFVTNISELSDADGVYAVEYTMELAEDTAWNSGQAQAITLTNLITAL